MSCKNSFVLFEQIIISREVRDSKDGGGIQDERGEGLSPSRGQARLVFCEESKQNT